jgi:hypothetical protein
MLNGSILCISPDRLLAVHVAEDSMVEAYIRDRDLAIFHSGLIEGSGMFVISVGNTLVVKRSNSKHQTITSQIAQNMYRKTYSIEDKTGQIVIFRLFGHKKFLNFDLRGKAGRSGLGQPDHRIIQCEPPHLLWDGTEGIAWIDGRVVACYYKMIFWKNEEKDERKG